MRNHIVDAPIAAFMVVYEDFERYYSQGIYEWDGVSPRVQGMHAVCLIGYVTSGPTRYWIGKNSWGDQWGEDGFFRIAFGECTIDDACWWMIAPSFNASSLARADEESGL